MIGHSGALCLAWQLTCRRQSVLKDQVVVKTFRNAFLNNKHLIKDKIVRTARSPLGIALTLRPSLRTRL